METPSSPIMNIGTNDEKALIASKKLQNSANSKPVNKINNGNTLDNYFQTMTKTKRTRPDSEENATMAKEAVEAKSSKNLSSIININFRNRIDEFTRKFTRKS